MDICNNLLHLDDLALYNICTYISCPFDLLNFGSTCRRIRKISSSQSLWWLLAFKWCRGLWIHMEDIPQQTNARDWLLNILKSYTIISTATKRTVQFSEGEIWERAESKKFRCLFGMLRLAYSRKKKDHPAVLYEQWLYDIGLFTRLKPGINYESADLSFAQRNIEELSNLSQAGERDLRKRKQPYKDPRYYIKKIGFATENWIDLFPSGPHGSICPLLMCPFQDAYTNELSGLFGLAACFSLIIEESLRHHLKSMFSPLHLIANIVKTLCKCFIDEIASVLPAMEARLGPHCLRSAVLTMISEGTFNHACFQQVLDAFNLPIKSRAMMLDLSKLLEKFEGIDIIVDEIRMFWRAKMLDEIADVLQLCKQKNVTRVNLTDSDLTGGDNSKQEMACAAFVSNSGVLVTWHLTGRMRY